MTSAPFPAASDLMTMLCRIGAGMREAVPSGVFVHFLMIGAMCPRFGALLEAWLFVEERLADGLALDDADWPDDGEAGSGWISQEGPVWRWRQVTRFGSVLVIPILWFVPRDAVGGLQVGLVRVASWSPLSGVVRWGSFFFGVDWHPPWNRGVFVPVCKRNRLCVGGTVRCQSASHPTARLREFAARAGG